MIQNFTDILTLKKYPYPVFLNEKTALASIRLKQAAMLNEWHVTVSIL